uniref:Uncharacterized protein n=1 Tax=Brassica oleracea TaxID=3712 RepID=A0A3P6EVK2_BRAOL|nr:unnamed protein product [Brassica oleracea]
MCHRHSRKRKTKKCRENSGDKKDMEFTRFQFLEDYSSW